MSKHVMFYGDGTKGKNYLYKFIVHSERDARNCVRRLAEKGVKNIRGIYYNDKRIE